MDIIKAVSAVALVACTSAGCGSGSSGSSNSSTPSSPSTVASAPFQISLPIAPGDSTSIGYGIWPFGVHGSSHALDGHPGFDFEYRLGAPVYAVIDATVSNRFPDSNSPGPRGFGADRSLPG